MSILPPPAPDAKPTPTTDAVVSEYETLLQAFDLLRERHQVDVMQPGLLACVCGERLPIVYDAEDQPLYNPIIRHHHEHYASAAAKRVAEFQWNAVEMARKADTAERRAEEAEFHVEQLRVARDRAERRIEKVEALVFPLADGGPTDDETLTVGEIRAALDFGGASA